MSTGVPRLASFTLTQKQQAVYDFIQRYFHDHSKSPLIREIQFGCQITSYKSALDRLNALERKGMIRRIPNKHRGIKLTRKANQSQVKIDEPSLEGAGEEVTA